MQEKIYYSVEDIARMLGVSEGKGYMFFGKMRLAGKGFLASTGKMPVEYFKVKWHEVMRI